MKKERIVICSMLLFLFSTTLLLHAQQKVKFDLAQESVSEYSVTAKEFSSVKDGDIYTDLIELRTLQSNIDGYVEMLPISFSDAFNIKVILQNIGGTVIHEVSMIKIAADDDIDYTFSGTNIGTHTGTIDISVLNNNPVRIERCENIISFQIGTQSPVLSTITNYSNEELKAQLEIISIETNIAGEVLNGIFSFPNFSKRTYVQLKRKLDASYTPVTGNNLKFKYIEKYATAVGNQITCDVINNAGVTVVSNPLPNKYGVNWQSLDISGLSTGEYYILKVKNSNKKETFYLRFRYD